MSPDPVMPLALPDYFSMASDLVVGLAALGTAATAIWGLWRWRTELAGKAKFDAARNLAKATYGVRNAVTQARSRFIDGRELPADDLDHDETGAAPTARAGHAYGHVFDRRWEPVWDALAAFDAAALEAEVFWGEDLRSATESLRSALNELRAATDAFISNEASGGEDFRQNREFGKQIRGTVFATSGKTDNVFSSRVADAVKGIEDQLRQHLLRE